MKKMINGRQYLLKSPTFYNFVRFVQLTKCYKIIDSGTCQKKNAFCKLTLEKFAASYFIEFIFVCVLIISYS